MNRHRIALLAASALFVVGCAATEEGWKAESDPTIVAFALEDAESVDQELVDPPFLPAHDQVASGPPRVVNIRMEIVEREVEILTLVNTTTDTVRSGRRTISWRTTSTSTPPRARWEAEG